MRNRLTKTMSIRVITNNRKGSFEVRVCYQPPYQMKKWTKFHFKQLKEVSVSLFPGLQKSLTSLTSAASATHWDTRKRGGGGVRMF